MIFTVQAYMNDDLLADTVPGSEDRGVVAALAAEAAYEAAFRGLVWHGARPDMGPPGLLNGLQERCQ